MKKFASILITCFFWCIISVLSSLCLLVAFFQTQYAKEKLRLFFIDLGKKQGIDLVIGKIEGDLPFSLDLTHVSVAKGSHRIEIDKVHCGIAMRSVLKGYPILSSIVIDELFLEEGGKALPITAGKLLKIRFPIPLSIESLIIRKLHLPLDLFPYPLHVRGSEFFETDLLSSQFSCEIRAEEPEPSLFEFQYRTGEKEFHLDALGIASFATPFHVENIHGSLENSHFEIHAKGQKETLQALLKEENSSRIDTLFPPIKAEFTGQIEKLEGLEGFHIFSPVKLQGAFQIFASRAFNISELKIDTPYLHGSISGSLDRSRRILGGRFSLRAKELENLTLPHPDLALLGQGIIKGDFDGKKTKIDFSLDELSIHGVHYKQLQGKLIGDALGLHYNGALELKAKHAQVPIELACKLSLEMEKNLQITDLVVKGPSTEFGGALLIDLKKWMYEGTLVGRCENLHAFQALFPKIYLNGSMAAEVKLFTDKKQNIHIHALLEDFFAGKLYVQNGSLDCDFYDLKHQTTGQLSFDINQGKYGDFDLKSGRFHTYWESGRWPYEISLQGFWKHPFELEVSGYWNYLQDTFALHINELFGYTLKKPFRITKSAVIQMSPEEFHLKNFFFDIGKGRLSCHAELTKEQSEIKIEGTGLPLDLIAVINPDFSFNGMTSIDAHFTEEEGRVKGNAHIYLDHAELLHFGRTDPSKAKGLLSLHYDHGALQTHLFLRSEHEQFLELTGTYPLELALFPFHYRFQEDKPFSAELTAEGFLQEIFDFIEPGFQRIEGFISSHLLASGKLSSPSLYGELDLQNGIYENFFIGASIKNIKAKAHASGQKILIDEITGTDGKSGKLHGSGEFFLSKKDHFPYRIELDLTSTKALGLDIIEAFATGKLMLFGDSSKMHVEGNVDLDKAIFTVSDALPTDVPQIPIQFINQPPTIGATKAKTAVPVYIDLKLNAKDNTLVRGKGLKSYWNGKIHVTGVNLNLSAEGLLSLTKGEFLFAGKSFSLTHGEISFSDKPQNPAHINLSGTLNLKSATIIATLKGPLTAPALTFTSNPPMPTSEIVSYILFDKPSSEVRPIEALQLAQTIVSLSGGGGPDILDAIRKKLGVDKLTIVSGKDASDQISVQIGRYVTKGVMVTLSQSPDKSDVIVEIDLSHGFTFQAETQDQEEGKFTLKWNCNY